jgi:hypothetical protein
VGNRCVTCDGKVVDAQGHEVGGEPDRVYRALTKRDRVGVVVSMVFGLGLGVLVVVLHLQPYGRFKTSVFVFGVGTALLMGVALPAYFARFHRQARRYDQHIGSWVDTWLDKAGPVTPIVDVDGVAHVRGKVIALSTIDGPHGPVVALRTREVYDDIQLVMGRRGLEPSTKRHMIEHAECGRFAVDDGTGVAIVDDDAFILWSEVGMRLHDESAITVSEGEEVEVAGVARREDVPNLPPAAANFRERRQTLVLDGTAKQPVIIKVLDGV